MTYASDVVRICFHQLPTEKQVEYSRMEETLAKHGQRLRIEAVTHYGNVLEVVIRVTENLESLLGPGDSLKRD